MVKIVDICTMLFYAINMDVVNLFTNSSLLFLTTLNLYCINILSQPKKINIFYFLSKKNVSLT